MSAEPNAILADAAASADALLRARRLDPGPTARAVLVPDGRNLVLDSGLKVRLAGLFVPKPEEGGRATQHADRARAALLDLVDGKQLRLYFDMCRRDDQGRALAQIVTETGVWVQRECVARGLARVYGFADNRAVLADLLSAERAARGRKAGVWRDPDYAVIAADAAQRLGSARGRLVVVAGRIFQVRSQPGGHLLVFSGAAGREFEAVIENSWGPLFAAAGLAPDRLAGLRLRVRGVLPASGMLRLTLTHPEQIEVLA